MIFLIFPELGIKRARLYQIWHPRFERQNQQRINNDTTQKQNSYMKILIWGFLLGVNFRNPWFINQSQNVT